MGSLLAVLEGQRDDGAIMRAMQVQREPEVVFYLARHFAMLNAPDESIDLLQRARTQGLASSHTLTNDAVFRRFGKRADFRRELDLARARELEARRGGFDGWRADNPVVERYLSRTVRMIAPS